MILSDTDHHAVFYYYWINQKENCLKYFQQFLRKNKNARPMADVSSHWNRDSEFPLGLTFRFTKKNIKKNREDDLPTNAQTDEAFIHLRRSS